MTEMTPEQASELYFDTLRSMHPSADESAIIARVESMSGHVESPPPEAEQLHELLMERNALAAKLDRVRELCDVADRKQGTPHLVHVDNIRAALEGPRRDIPHELVEKAALAIGSVLGGDTGEVYAAARAALEAVWPDLVTGEGVDTFSKVSHIDFDEDDDAPPC